MSACRSEARRPRWRRVVMIVVIGAATLAPIRDVVAAGMFFTARGARPLGRAGAFVAGADDLGAIYYNPAGLGGTGRLSILVDAGLVLDRVHYDRVDSGGNALSGVDAQRSLLPLPFLGISWQPKALHGRLTLAGALFTPYASLYRYDLTGPQRYSLGSLEGTALAVAELAVSVRVARHFYLGAGFQNLFVRLANTIVLSGCTSLNCAPEDPNFDVATEARVNGLFTPSGNVGFLVDTRHVRIGGTFQLPYYVRASGRLRTRLPADPQFDQAVVVGDRVDVAFNLPWAVRGGVEVRPTASLRIEVGADYEAWQQQDQFRFTPRGVYLDNVIGVGRYDLGPLSLNRSLQGAIGASVGGELEILGRLLTLRAGYRYETSAVPSATLTVLTPDGDKHLIAGGIALRIWKLRIDVSYGHVFQADRTVTDSMSFQLQPIRPPQPVAVGNGTYRVARDVVAAGIELRF